jgi:hypothetical protein
MNARNVSQDRHLPNTKAYLRFREQTQASFDFAVVVCHGVPSLKRQISLLEQGVIKTLPDADYFPTSSNLDQLRKRTDGYRQRLAAYTLITNFSFFEAFVTAAINEMIEFHGGREELLRRSEQRERHFIGQNNLSIESHRRRLRGTIKNETLWRRFTNIRKLRDMGYRFPSELFSSYGIRMLLQKLGNLRSVDIPDLLIHGLHMSLNDTMVEDFHSVRDIRNRIAHGAPVSLSMKDLSQHNSVLREFAIAIDRHLNRHYLIAEDTFRRTYFRG